MSVHRVANEKELRDLVEIILHDASQDPKLKFLMQTAIEDEKVDRAMLMCIGFHTGATAVLRGMMEGKIISVGGEN